MRVLTVNSLLLVITVHLGNCGKSSKKALRYSLLLFELLAPVLNCALRAAFAACTSVAIKFFTRSVKGVPSARVNNGRQVAFGKRLLTVSAHLLSTQKQASVLRSGWCVHWVHLPSTVTRPHPLHVGPFGSLAREGGPLLAPLRLVCGTNFVVIVACPPTFCLFRSRYHKSTMHLVSTISRIVRSTNEQYSIMEPGLFSAFSYHEWRRTLTFGMTFRTFLFSSSPFISPSAKISTARCSDTDKAAAPALETIMLILLTYALAASMFAPSPRLHLISASWCSSGITLARAASAAG